MGTSKIKYTQTCSIFNLKNNAVTFIRKEEYFSELINTDKHVCVIAPVEFIHSDLVKDIPSHISMMWLEGVHVDHTFFKIHNKIYEDFTPPERIIGQNCNIHESVIMDVDGIKFANCPDGRKIQFKHIGNLIIEDDVDIGPLCVIHRGTIDSTIIKKGAKLASKINIGHNAIIGENTVIASGATLGGTVIGNNCWIGMAAIINQGLKICDNVVIGSGSLVTKDITEPGIYVGNPAKFLKPITEGWNF